MEKNLKNTFNLFSEICFCQVENFTKKNTNTKQLGYYSIIKKNYNHLIGYQYPSW